MESMRRVHSGRRYVEKLVQLLGGDAPQVLLLQSILQGLY
jgi:hypothetical protein